jgi:pilus assembly protein TadC
LIGAPAVSDSLRRAITFERLERVSLFHSLVYLALLIVAFGLGNPQPYTFILGLSHGLLWIAMSLVCLAAVRLRVIPLRIAVAVAVLGGLAPFFGSAEFIREQRRRERVEA